MNSQYYKEEHYTLAETLERYLVDTSIYIPDNLFIYPMMGTNYTCTLMPLTNLAEPDWLQIPCMKPLLDEFLCVKLTYSNASFNLNEINSTKFCTKNCIIFNTTCYEFFWQKPRYSQQCFDFNKRLAHRNTIAKISKQLIDYVSVEKAFPLFLVYFKSNIAVTLKVKKYNSILISKVYSFSDNMEAFHTCQQNKREIFHGEMTFKCTTGGYIHSEYVCDGYIDCPNDKSDENTCNCQSNLVTSTYMLATMTGKRKYCSNVYFLDYKSQCKKYKNTNLNDVFNKYSITFKSNDSDKWSHSTNIFECSDGKILSSELVNDLLADCGTEADDEQLLKSILVNGSYFECEHSSELPCKEGHPRCYNLTDICIFKLNLVNQLKPCRNGGHLENCGKFECNLMFKCLNAYCIPWAYVCNGKWDCPEGDDEIYDSLCEKKQVCFFMYKCKKTSNVCIHTGNLCDGSNDCPYSDDESLCDLKHFKCPEYCRCLLFSIDCNNASLTNIVRHGPFSFFSVVMSNSSLNSITDLTRLMVDSLVVKLPRNGILEVCINYNLKEVVLFDVSFNSLKIIKNMCFIQMLKLVSLSLNDNEIKLVEEKSFFNVKHLKFLNLSNNPLINFPTIFSICRHYVKLGVINLTNLTGKHRSIDATFTSVTLVKVVVTENYQFCCLSPPETICIAQPSGYISCSELLPNNSLKIVFITVSCAIISLSILSICLHIKSMSKKVYSTIVFSLNLNEAICGLYVISISVANIIYSENFYYEQDIWRSSAICFATSGAVIWYKISAEMHHVFLSLSRVMAVIYPIDTIFKKVGFAKKILFFIHTSSFTFSVLFTTLHKIKHDTTISFCFPFVDPTKKLFLIKFIVWFVALTEVISSVLIMILHIGLVIKVRKSQKNTVTFKSKTTSVNLLAVQLAIPTICMILCWYPANVVYITVMFLSTYPIDLIILTIALIFPINSVVNPWIFMVAAIKKENKFSKVNYKLNIFDPQIMKLIN